MPLVTAWKSRLLNRAFRNTSYTLPSAFKWAPFSSSPSADGTGGTEQTTNGAGRRTFTFAAPSLGQIANAGSIAAASVASGDWATTSHFAVFGTVGGVDEIVFYGPTVPAQLVLTGDSWTLLAGQVQEANLGEGADEFLTFFSVDRLLSQLAGLTSPSWPATVFAALLTGPFDRAGANGSEVTGTGYSRKAVAFAAPSGSPTVSIVPTAAINFGSAGSAWGLVSHVGFYDASTGGNLMAQVALSAAANIVNGSPANFPAAQCAITLL